VFSYDICNIWRRNRKPWLIWFLTAFILVGISVVSIPSFSSLSFDIIWNQVMGKGNFVLPFVFIYFCCYLLLLNGSYLAQELYGCSSTVMIRISSRKRWLQGKLLFSIFLSVMYSLLLILFVHIWTLIVMGDFTYPIDTIYSFFTVILSFVFLTVLQTCLLLFLPPVACFVIILVVILLSLYISTPYLPGIHLLVDQVNWEEDRIIQDIKFFLGAFIFSGIIYFISVSRLTSKDLLREKRGENS
jgi:hypothetical protein